MIRLADQFDGVMYKRLSEVEVDPTKSNQHEFTGTIGMKRVLGTERRELDAQFVRIGVDETRDVSWSGRVTWYDAREAHPTRSEYRLYFKDNPVVAAADAGDVLIVGLRADGSALFVLVDQHSPDLITVLWLFGIQADLLSGHEAGATSRARDVDVDATGDRPNSVVQLVAERLGLPFERDVGDGWLDLLKSRFGDAFPTTKEFSALALETLADEPRDASPDDAVIMLMDREEELFRQFEKHVVSERISQLSSGWASDVDGFVSYSLSVQNRRKSRAGHAFENHLGWLFAANHVRFERGATTEGRSRPDFLFPDTGAYHDAAYPIEKLTMLGAKTSCKDRWRQVLNEASRIENKHLCTLQPSMTVAQLTEMSQARLQLVVPRSLHVGYPSDAPRPPLAIGEFIDLVKLRQA